jgi:hypothetical protein
MSMQEDMLRETCPEDLQEYKRRQEMERRRAAALSGQPTALLLFGPPLILCAGVVLVAALHHALGAPLGGGFQLNVFLRDVDTVYRTYNTQGRGTAQISYGFPLVDLLPYGRQEEWQDSPDGWPQSPTYSKWLDSPAVARLYGPS